jgi:CO dehydrogenase nickel-insertion accessory protein CooC1
MKKINALLLTTLLITSQAVLADDKDASYNMGTQHGCEAGGNATGDYTKAFKKDVDRYINDQYYKTGWDDGFQQCKAQGEIINRAIQDSLN